MKLNLLDFLYLGINIFSYKAEEIKILKANLEVEDLINELLNEENYSSIKFFDIDARAYNLNIYHDIYKGLCDIYCELRFLESYSPYKFDNLEGHFKVILKGMIELREKGIHQDLEEFEISLLKECNIKNLKTLFFERYTREKYLFGDVEISVEEKEVIKPFKIHAGYETQKIIELEGFLKRYVELISNAFPTLEFYNRLMALTVEYKKYEADNFDRKIRNY